MPQKEASKKEAVLYVVYYIAGTLFTFFRSFVYASLLTPSEFGDLSKLILYKNTLLLFASAGMLLLAQKRLPMAYAREEHQDSQKLISGSVLIFYIVAILGTFILLAAVLFRIFNFSVFWFYSLLIIYSLSQYIFLVMSTDLRSSFERDTYAKVYAARALSLFTIAATLLWLPGAVSISFLVLIEIIVSLLIAAKIISNRGQIDFFFSYKEIFGCWEWVWQNLGEGLRLLFLSSTVVMLKSLDRWIGTFVLSREDYGIYSAGLIFLTAVETLEVMANQYIFPVISRSFGVSGFLATYRMTKRISIYTLLLGVIFLLPTIVGIRYLIELALPQYSQATNIIPVFILTGIFVVSNFFLAFCTLCNLERELSLAFVLLSLGISGFYILFSRIGIIIQTPFSVSLIALTSAIALWCIAYVMGVNAKAKYFVK